MLWWLTVLPIRSIIWPNWENFVTPNDPSLVSGSFVKDLFVAGSSHSSSSVDLFALFLHLAFPVCTTGRLPGILFVFLS